MVDSVGATPITDTGATRIVGSTTVVATAATSATSAAPAATDTAQTGSLAKSMAASAPVDSDRVATIKKAIQDGRFPLLPATIADRLIALKLQWNPNGADSDAA